MIVEHLIGPAVKQHLQPFRCVYPEVIAAFRAYLFAGFKILLPDKRPTAIALDEQPFRPNRLFFLFGVGDRVFFFFE